MVPVVPFQCDLRSSAVKSDDSVVPSVVKLLQLGLTLRRSGRNIRAWSELQWRWFQFAWGLQADGVAADVHFPAQQIYRCDTQLHHCPAVVSMEVAGKVGIAVVPVVRYTCDNMFRWASRALLSLMLKLGTDPTEPCPAHDDNTTMGYSVCGNFPACCEGPLRHPGPDDSCQLGDPKPTLYASASRCPPIATSCPVSG